ncbi:MAG: S8 family serine peptidase [Bacteroidales bacterium]|nr:S8 family serine peptidase [Bacteroidales bacterium]
MRLNLPSGVKFHGIAVGFLLLAILAGCQKSSFESTSGVVDDAQTTAIAGGNGQNYIVISKTETLPAGFEKQISAYGEIVSSIPEIGQVVVRPTTVNFEKKVSKLENVRSVIADLKMRWVDPVDFLGQVSSESIGDDERFFAYQWNMRAIFAPAAWDEGFTGEGVRVFVLDEGIDADNPDLASNLNDNLSTSFVPGETYNVGDGNFFNHGTHVAGIIAAADNEWGVIGVAPYAEIVAVKVLSEYSGSGYFSWINQGIVYAANNGADVINMSLGGTLYRNGFYIDDDGILQKMPAVYYQEAILAQQRAVDYAWRKGAVIVSSAGNSSINFDGGGPIFKLPAGLNNVITVSATGPDCWITTPVPNFDLPASYTDYGKSYVEIAAPGGDFDCDAGYPYDMVLSCGTGGPGYSFYFAAGTSMASPHVAGVAALIIGKNGGNMNPFEVTKKLLNTADKIDGLGISPWYGKGRVNAYRAVTE